MRIRGEGRSGFLEECTDGEGRGEGCEMSGKVDWLGKVRLGLSCAAYIRESGPDARMDLLWTGAVGSGRERGGAASRMTSQWG
jgi:hypothetical protein